MSGTARPTAIWHIAMPLDGSRPLHQKRTFGPSLNRIFLCVFGTDRFPIQFGGTEAVSIAPARA